MEKDYIPIITRSQSLKVFVDDIMMIQKENRKLIVVTERARYGYYAKMEDVLPNLGRCFFPCTKGLVVNFEKAVMVAESGICFYNGFFLGLSREVFIRTRQAFNRYLRETQRKKGPGRPNGRDPL